MLTFQNPGLGICTIHRITIRDTHVLYNGAWWIKIHVVASMEAIIGANSHCIKVEVGGFVQLWGDHNFVHKVLR